MNNGKEIPLAHTHNKNFYLENETKKHPLLQFLQKNISNKIEPTEEREKSNRKSSFAKKKSKFIAKPESSSNINNNNDNNNNIKTYNDKNNNDFPTPINSVRRSSRYNTNLGIGKKLLLCSNLKKKNTIDNSNENEVISENNNIIKPEEEQPKRSEKISCFSSVKDFACFNKQNSELENNSISTKLTQSLNKTIKTVKKISYRNFGDNNSVFISQPKPLKIQSFYRFGPDKGVVQKTVTLDVLATTRVYNQKQSFPKLSPFFAKKLSNLNVDSNKKNEDKKQTRLFPSLKVFNFTKLENNFINKKENSEEDNNINLKNSQNNSKDNSRNRSNIFQQNSNIYKFFTNNSISSINKPTIINDSSIKSTKEYNNFSTPNNNLYSIKNYNDKNIDKNNTTPIDRRRRLSTVRQNIESQKIMKNERRLSVEKLETQKETLDKQRTNKKKVTMCLKNNLKIFNQIMYDKKKEDDNKGKIKEKFSLFRGKKPLNKNEPNEEKEKSDSESENNNNDNNQNLNKFNSNNNNNINFFGSRFSSRKESLSLSNDDSSSSSKTKKKFIKKISINDNEGKKSDKKNLEKNADNSSVDKNVNDGNSLNLEFDSNSNESDNNSKKQKDEYISGSDKKVKKVKNKYLMKYEDEKLFTKKQKSKIKLQLNKINEESYVYNSCKKEIINNFIQNTVLEKITDKIIETFGLLYLDEEKADQLYQQKFLIYDKKGAFKEELNELINSISFVQMKKIFKIIYTKKITIKYNFNLLHVQDSLNIYEDYLLHLMNNSWFRINSKFEHSLEMIKFITENKTITNYESKRSAVFDVNYNKVDKPKKVYSSSVIRRKEILKSDRNFFKYLESIQKELHLKTANLYLKLNVLDFGLQESTNLSTTLCNTNNVRFKRREKKKINLSTISKHKKNFLMKNFKNSNSIIKLAKRQSLFVPKAKVAAFSFNIENSIKKENKENELVKIKDAILVKNPLFRNSKNVKRLNTIDALRHENKKNKQLEVEEKYKKDVEKKEKSLNETENNLNTLNLLKNKCLFDKKYKEDSLDVEKKINLFYRDLQNLWDINTKLKSETIISKSSGYDPLTREAVSIKTQEIENDLPDVRLFEKFVFVLQSRKVNLFKKYVELEGNKFLNIINKQDVSSGNTLLHFAVQSKIIKTIEILLTKGANPNIQNTFGNTPLHLAYKFNSSLMINLLLQYNADKKISNYDGLLPWQMSRYDTD